MSNINDEPSWEDISSGVDDTVDCFCCGRMVFRNTTHKERAKLDKNTSLIVSVCALCEGIPADRWDPWMGKNPPKSLGRVEN